nr:hypothetical protein [Riboviria sp.]
MTPNDCIDETLVDKHRRLKLELEILQLELERSNFINHIDQVTKIQSQPLQPLIQHLETVLSHKKRDISFFNLLTAETQAFCNRYQITDHEIIHQLVAESTQYFTNPTSIETILADPNSTNAINTTNSLLTDTLTNMNHFQTASTQSWSSIIISLIMYLLIIPKLYIIIRQYFAPNPSTHTMPNHITTKRPHSISDIVSHVSHLASKPLDRPDAPHPTTAFPNTSSTQPSTSSDHSDPRFRYNHSHERNTSTPCPPNINITCTGTHQTSPM